MFDLRVAVYKRQANNDGFLGDAPEGFFLAHLFAAFTVEHYRVRQPGFSLLVGAALKIKQKCTSICPEPFSGVLLYIRRCSCLGRLRNSFRSYLPVSCKKCIRRCSCFGRVEKYTSRCSSVGRARHW